MRKFNCIPQVYTARPGAGYVSSLYTFSHSLGVQPHITRLFLECLIPDLGYPVGAIVPVDEHSADRKVISGIPGDYIATGLSIVVTPLDLIVSFDTNHGASIHQFDTKKNGRLNNTAWRIRPKVYAP